MSEVKTWHNAKHFSRFGQQVFFHSPLVSGWREGGGGGLFR